MHITRRDFLRSAAMSAALAAAAGFPLPKDADAAAAAQPEKWVKGVCRYCHREVGAANLTMDHVIPVARGGRSTRGNCVPCCKECNSSKKAYTPAEQILMRLESEEKGSYTYLVLPCHLK